MKPFIKIVSFASLSLLMGCASFEALPEFTLDGSKRNSLIVDRKPQYGNGRRDGCIVMGEMNVELRQEEPGRYSGLVQDVAEQETVFAVDIIVNPDTEEAREFKTALNGSFSFEYSQPIRQILFDGFTYRKLLVNLR